MIYREFIEFCEQQEEKPENTTKFIKQFQQTNSKKGTYLYNAKKAGQSICKCEGEPNQKWHLLTSWYSDKEETISESNIEEWCRLKCPELLLWIAEVAGQEEKVEEVVKCIFRDEDGVYTANDGEARRKMENYIKTQIKWTDIKNFIEKYEENS